MQFCLIFVILNRNKEAAKKNDEWFIRFVSIHFDSIFIFLKINWKDNPVIKYFIISWTRRLCLDPPKSPHRRFCYNALWKITHFEKCFQSALNLGPSQRTLNFFFIFQSALIWGILTHFEKKNRKSYFVWLTLFFLFKNFKYNY